MATRPLTIEQYINRFRDNILSEMGELADFSEGSVLDIITGSAGMTLNELSELVIASFRKTFFETAEGEDLDSLAVDHFGPEFARPVAKSSSVRLRFSRENAGPEILIPQSFQVSTPLDARGNNIIFETNQDLILAGTEGEVDAVSTESGASQNVPAGSLTVPLDSLADPSVTVTNPQASVGGLDAETDPEYRETIKRKINSLSGATKNSIRSALLSVPGIGFVTLVENSQVVVPYDIGHSRIARNEQGQALPWFRIVNPVAYISDDSGGSNQQLVESALAAIQNVKACGVDLRVEGASVFSLDITARAVIRAGGPNNAEFIQDISKIVDTVRDSINNNIQIGDGFSRQNLIDYVLGIWGPAGTGDLSGFDVLTPRLDISGSTGLKIIAGDIQIGQ